MPNPIIIEFIADTTQLDKAVDSLEQLGSVDKNAADQFRKSNTEFLNRKKHLQDAGKYTDDLTESVKKVPKKIVDDAAVEGIEEANKRTKHWTESMAAAGRQNKEVRITMEALTAVQKGWNSYMADSIGLARTMKIAFAGIGIGALVVGIWAAVHAWKAYVERQEEAYKDSTRMAEINTRVAESTNAMAVELDGYVRKLKDENTTVKEKEGILQIVNEKYGDQIGHFKDLNDLETNFIERAPAYIQVLLLRAQAQAALNLAMEQQQQIMRNELPAAIEENVKWYDVLGGVLNTVGGGMANVGNVVGAAADRVNESTEEATDNMEFYLQKFTEFSLQAQELVNQYGFEAGKAAETTAKVVRDIWKVMDPVELIGTPDRIGPEIVEPTIKAMGDMNERLKKMRKDAMDEAAKNRQEELEDIQAHYEQAAAIAEGSFNAIIGFSIQLKENELQNLQERLANGSISQKEFEKQAAEVKTQIAKQEKAAAVFHALLAIPSAFLTGLVQGGLPLAIGYGSIATVELAAVLAQKIPKFAKGTRKVEGGTAGQDSVLAMLMPGERVTRTAVNQEYTPILDAIDDRRIPAWYLNAMVNTPDISGMLPQGVTLAGGSAGIDYERLQEVFGKEIGKIPVNIMNWDERGIHRSIVHGTRRIEFMDKRYRSI